ncbi:olfactory receptor 14A16-like [Ornithorhynchus anatinus]|uniref:olfactory receptor 14A16-like n=1 Tax=Ornithorhynchus anatinus TaxID=9258 RepID=UPI0010A9165A|nr:olfactory receptor 14A16-like [Ornithorhynchus anatinus]
MSYDRYVAICHPLHYEHIMDRAVCTQMIATSWFNGDTFGVMYMVGTFSMPFCGFPMVQQFFCDAPSLLKASRFKRQVVLDIPFCKLCPLSEPLWTVHRLSQNNIHHCDWIPPWEFLEVWELQLVHAALFLLVYLVSLVGNLLIVTVTALNQHHHTPMYFFLRNLSFVDLCLISITVPKSIHNSLTHTRAISFLDCIAQIFLVILLVGVELFILTVMSYECYVVICHPLCYDVTMNRETCVKLATASWLGGGIFGMMYTAGSFSLLFCGSPIFLQFLCDASSLLMVSCSNTHVVFAFSLVSGFVCALFSFVSTVISYICIFWAVLRMPATEGWAKVFSTSVELVVSVFYTTVPPALNPLIYSLRNRDVKAALEKVLEWDIHSL